MIDPTKVTDFHRSNEALIEFWLFAFMVAGKRSTRIAPLVDRLLTATPGASTMEKVLHIADPAHTRPILERFGIAPYKDRLPAFQATGQRLSRDAEYLRHATVEDLTTIAGVSDKTARFFVLHSRPDQQYAVLDTHILRWMRSLGIADVPKLTPSGAKYIKLEKTLLEICRATGCLPSKLDLDTWTEGQRRPAPRQKSKASKILMPRPVRRPTPPALPTPRRANPLLPFD